jgi:asparagine synthase (glutamine-hydrolysing)
MCGITGYINLNKEPVRDTGKILSMLRVQKHRGPDDFGIRAFTLRKGRSLELSRVEERPIDGSFEGILGFNRLSILDLSMNGHQPMVSPDNKVLLTLNGEIYNAFDFSKELTNWGYRFKSTSDSEIVLALYLKYGFEGLLERLNGMFAIVIIDLRSGTLFIVRDRFGIKPMYYIHTNKIFAFSSELKSFGYLDNFTFRLDESQLDEYMLFRGNIKGTLYKDIHSLKPGNYLTFSYEKGLINRCFFDVNCFTRVSTDNQSIEAYEKVMESHLGRSVERQLMSDVKLGCQLSGGIDSSLVTYFANKKAQKEHFESVSIIFSDPRFNEEKYIDQVAGQLGIKAHKFLLDTSYYLRNLEKATWHLETPINHPNTIGIYLLSQRAKEYVTVLLSGEGADEVFGGYSWYYDVRYPFSRRIILSKIKNFANNPAELVSYLDPVYRAVIATAYMPSRIAVKLKKDFSFGRATTERIKLYNSLEGSIFDRQVKYEMLTYLPELLIRQDKMSMAHSIENRVPYLDNEVVANAFNIPEKYFLMRKSPEGLNTEKYMLKKMTARIFNPDFAFRNKMGFGIPLRQYFLDKKFNSYLNDKVIPGIRKRGIFEHKIVENWLSGLASIKYIELESLWIALTFEIWASVYLDHTYENRDTSF